MSQLLRDVVPRAGGELVDAFPTEDPGGCLAVGPKDASKGPAAKEVRTSPLRYTSATSADGCPSPFSAASCCPIFALVFFDARGAARTSFAVSDSRSVTFMICMQVKGVVAAGGAVYEPEVLLAGIVQQRLDLGSTHKVA